MCGVFNFDGVVDEVGEEFVLCVFWFDCFVMNIDCMLCNFNLFWFEELFWFIDYGVVIYFYYGWSLEFLLNFVVLFVGVSDYVLL